MRILGIDPGPRQSALVVWNGTEFTDQGEYDNEYLLSRLAVSQLDGHIAIEKVMNYGMIVGADVFETVYWTGCFVTAWEYPKWDDANSEMTRTSSRIPWPEVARHHCHKTSGVKESNVRQVLIDRFGPGKREAIGLKASQGPLYRIKGHMWSAAAVALVEFDRQQEAE